MRVLMRRKRLLIQRMSKAITGVISSAKIASRALR